MSENDRVREAQAFSAGWVVNLAFAGARWAPRWFGYTVAGFIGWLSARLSPKRRSILEANLAHVLPGADRRHLRKVANEVFVHALRSYYDILYLSRVSPKKTARLITFDEPGWSQLEEVRAGGRGVVIAVTHQSSFDLAGQAISARGHPMFTLGLPAPGKTMALFNKLRTAKGLRIIPVGPRAVREAIRSLRRGEVVAIAADRPVRGQGMVIQFFGRPTLLPDAHVRLALQTGAAIFCTSVRRVGGRYHLRTEPYETTRTGDKETDIRQNAQRIAAVLEGFIRERPEQWHMFQKLWD